MQDDGLQLGSSGGLEETPDMDYAGDATASMTQQRRWMRKQYYLVRFGVGIQSQPYDLDTTL
jgi:hypothetical protein